MADTLARPPIGYERITAKRALLSALGPLAGLRAEGNVTATATSADVVLPAFSYGVPVIGGRAHVARMVKTLEDTTITSAGTPVAVRSVCGGSSGNLPEGTVIVWQPLPTGLAPRGVVDEDGITGGLAQDGPGRCARVVAFETLGKNAAEAIWEAPGTGLPMIVVARSGSTTTGNSTVASTHREHTFTILVVSANQADNDERAEEGELLLDAIESTLDGLSDVEGDVFSGPPCELGPETRERPRSANVHVWSLEAKVYYSLRRIDVRLSDGVTWQPWQTTRLEVAEPATGTQDAATLADVTAEQEQ